MITKINDLQLVSFKEIDRNENNSLNLAKVDGLWVWMISEPSTL